MAKQIIEETDEQVFLDKINTLANSGTGWDLQGFPVFTLTETNEILYTALFSNT